jgi:uncharacterized protein (TIGR03437 family)
MKKFFAVPALLAIAACAVSAQQYTISTIAGIPQVQGYFGDGSAATGAQLFRPQRVVVDSKGNYYISDYYTFAVRKVDTSGNISTIAGNGTPGFAGDNDAATSANILQVHGIAVDSNGNVFISDTGNSRIRKIDTKGVITTFAGNGTPGLSGDGNAASAASLWFPAGLAFDGSGNLYVSDYGNSTIRKISSSGTITAFAGTGFFGYSGDGAAASKAALASPMSLAIDGAGNIYVGDVGNNTIRKITTDGNIRTLVSGVTPQSLAVDAAGNLYFVDGLAPVVRKVLPSGSIVTIAGNGQTGYCCDGGQATLANLDHPAGVSVDASGKVYVADSNNQVIRLLAPVAFSVGAVANSASNAQGAIAPGEIVTIYGTGIGPTTLTPANAVNGSYPTQVAQTSVSFNGVNAPLLYVSSNLIAAIAPYGLATVSTANVNVTYQGNKTVTTVVPVTATAPGVFTANATGAGQAAALNGDLTVNGPSNPAKIGNSIVLYISGAGLTNPATVDGAITSGTAPFPAVVLPVQVTIGGKTASVTYQGATPLTVGGLTQVNAVIQSGTPTGAAVPVTVTVGGVQAQSGVTIAIQ